MFDTMNTDWVGTCYVSADWILENMWQFPNETWWEATLNGEHRQFVRIRLDVEKQEYVLDAVGQDLKYSEELWRYKGGDWQFLSQNEIVRLRQEIAELKEQLQDERDNRGDVISKFF
jgi:hypothetical protein